MDIEETLQNLLKNILDKLEVQYTKIIVTQDERDNYAINIDSENPSILIGYHGDNIQALQHILKTIAWQKLKNQQFNILLDIDEYRKRQEENVIKLAERKIEKTRETGRPQHLPPMSAYFRRKVHMLCMGAGFNDIETISEDTGDRRHVIIKLK